MKKLLPKKQFLFLWGNGREYNDYMCHDLEQFKNVFVINRKENQTWHEKRRILLKKYKNEKISEWVFRRQCARELKLKKNKINYLIFSEDYFYRIDRNILKKLCEQYKIKAVLYVVNPIERRMNLGWDKLSFYKKKFDLIITTDREDARKYDIAFFPLFYSAIPEKQSMDIKYDCAFIGRDKGRGNLIKKIDAEIKKRELTSYFRLRDGMDTKSSEEAWIPYDKILGIVSQSNCLVEVLQENQSGISLRAMEAVIFNKKLLTNNKDIIHYPFYDERFIRVFSDINDIDFDFIKERIDVCYNYHGECSPVQFLKRVVRLLSEKESIG